MRKLVAVLVQLVLIDTSRSRKEHRLIWVTPVDIYSSTRGLDRPERHTIPGIALASLTVLFLVMLQLCWSKRVRALWNKR